jgi:hypothetical protein
MINSKTLEKLLRIAVDLQFPTEDSNSNNNSIQFFIIYVPSQQPQGQLQAQHSVVTSSYIRDKQNIKSRTN